MNAYVFFVYHLFPFAPPSVLMPGLYSQSMFLFHHRKIVKGRETIKRADNYRGKTEQDWQKRKGRHGAMKQSRYEQETIVSYNAGEQTATIYTRDKAVM